MATRAVYGHSRWAVAAGGVLAGLGSLTMAAGLVFLFQGLARGNAPDIGGAVATVAGFLFLAFGGAQVSSAIGIWRHAGWARNLGLALAGVGAIVSGIVLPTAFNTVYVGVGEFRETLVAVGPSPTSIVIGLSFFPFLFVVIGLVMGARHFRA